MACCEPLGHELALTNYVARQVWVVRQMTHVSNPWCWREIEGQRGKHVWGILRILSVLIYNWSHGYKLDTC